MLPFVMAFHKLLNFMLLFTQRQRSQSALFVLVPVSFNHLAGRLPGRWQKERPEKWLFMACWHSRCNSTSWPCVPWNRIELCSLIACTFRCLIKYLFLSKKQRSRETEVKQMIKLPSKWSRWRRRNGTKRRGETEGKSKHTTACLKKLRCYTIVYHNKTKQPLLHQPRGVSEREKRDSDWIFLYSHKIK